MFWKDNPKLLIARRRSRGRIEYKIRRPVSTTSVLIRTGCFRQGLYKWYRGAGVLQIADGILQVLYRFIGYGSTLGVPS